VRATFSATDLLRNNWPRRRFAVRTALRTHTCARATRRSNATRDPVNVKSVGFVISRLFLTPPSSALVISRPPAHSHSLSLERRAYTRTHAHTYLERRIACLRSRAHDACRYTSDPKCNETSAIRAVSRPVTVR